MESPGTLADGRPLDYGFGVRITRYRGTRLVSHIGAESGYRAFLSRLPDRRPPGACLADLGNMDPVALSLGVLDVFLGAVEGETSPADYFAAGVLQGIQETPDVPCPPEAGPELAGEYWSDELETTFVIGNRDGRLCLSAPYDGRALRLIDRERLRFIAGDLTLEFGLDEDGRAASLIVSIGRVRDLRFARVDRARQRRGSLPVAARAR